MAGIALNQAIPLNRVWSFPKEIVLPSKFAMLPVGTTARLIQVWDPMRALMINRIDISRGINLVPRRRITESGCARWKILA